MQEAVYPYFRSGKPPHLELFEPVHHFCIVRCIVTYNAQHLVVDESIVQIGGRITHSVLNTESNQYCMDGVGKSDTGVPTTETGCDVSDRCQPTVHILTRIKKLDVPETFQDESPNM
jgi:hypothetical protein